ncbi:MAG: MlaD family protein [Ignavibacteriaceae bacterium]|jgi:phospholipid/cholesterol/gamma-HCH transport system substrate-binding protein
MESKGSTIRLGIFILIGSILFLVAVFLLGNKQALFASTFEVKAYFSTIEGLRKGAPVRLSGIEVGNVNDLRIMKDSTARVEVTLRLISDLKPMLKKDTRASIETEGLVGNKVVVLRMGSNAAELIEDGGTIQSDDPLNFGALVEEAKGTLEYTKDMARNLAEIVGKVNNGSGSIGKLVNNDDLYNNTNRLIVTADRSLGSISYKLDTLANVVNTLGTDVQSVVRNVDHSVKGIDELINNVQSGKGVLGKMLSDKSPLDSSLASVFANLIKITEETKLGTERFSENMEALKYNWLFKSYFEQRGMYDKPGYEQKLDKFLEDINTRIKILDDRIKKLNSLMNEKKLGSVN